LKCVIGGQDLSSLALQVSLQHCKDVIVVFHYASQKLIETIDTLLEALDSDEPDPKNGCQN
jgi:hypothetical protein